MSGGYAKWRKGRRRDGIQGLAASEGHGDPAPVTGNETLLLYYKIIWAILQK
jgi:hypothetical protein